MFAIEYHIVDSFVLTKWSQNENGIGLCADDWRANNVNEWPLTLLCAISRTENSEKVWRRQQWNRRLSNIRVFALRKCKQNKSLATCIKDELVTLELETIRFLFVLFKLGMEQVYDAHRREPKSHLIKEMKKNLTFHIQIVWFSDCLAAWRIDWRKNMINGEREREDGIRNRKRRGEMDACHKRRMRRKRN